LLELLNVGVDGIYEGGGQVGDVLRVSLPNLEDEFEGTS
jgi:hypothetical protein